MIFGLALFSGTGCATMAGETAGENVDDFNDACESYWR